MVRVTSDGPVPCGSGRVLSRRPANAVKDRDEACRLQGRVRSEKDGSGCSVDDALGVPAQAVRKPSHRASQTAWRGPGSLRRERRGRTDVGIGTVWRLSRGRTLVASGHRSLAREPRASTGGEVAGSLSAVAFQMSCPGNVELESDFTPKERPSGPQSM